MQLTCLITTYKFCYSLCCYVWRIFYLTNIWVVWFAHRVQLKVMLWLLTLIHVCLDTLPERILTIERLHRYHVFVSLPIVFCHTKYKYFVLTVYLIVALLFKLIDLIIFVFYWFDIINFYNSIGLICSTQIQQLILI